MKKSWVRTAAIAALAAVGSSAQAASVTLTGWAFGTGNAVHSTLYSGAAGGFGGSLTGADAASTPSFTTYCIELGEFFHFSTSPMLDYTVVGGADYFQRRRNDAGIAERLGQLLTWVAGHPDRVNIAVESTSLQLAIWNLVYDNDWSVTSGSGFSDTSIYRTYANDLLEGARVTSSRYDVFALERAGKQDFILATLRPLPQSRQSNGSAVPEPASLALVAVALAALSVARRRA